MRYNRKKLRKFIEKERMLWYSKISLGFKEFEVFPTLWDEAKKDFKEYQITVKHMEKANHGAVLNPCPPFCRGGEVSEDVINSDYFVGYGFKKDLVPVQQAILCYLLDK